MLTCYHTNIVQSVHIAHILVVEYTSSCGVLEVPDIDTAE